MIWLTPEEVRSIVTQSATHQGDNRGWFHPTVAFQQADGFGFNAVSSPSLELPQFGDVGDVGDAWAQVEAVQSTADAGVSDGLEGAMVMANASAFPDVVHEPLVDAMPEMLEDLLPLEIEDAVAIV